jgi:hypothetical protein
MLTYALICLSLALSGAVGLQLAYMVYLDRLDRDRKKRLNYLERRCRRLSQRLESAEARIAEQDAMIDLLQIPEDIEEPWADVLDDH